MKVAGEGAGRLGVWLEAALLHLLLLVLLGGSFAAMGSGAQLPSLMLPLALLVAVWGGLRFRLYAVLSVTLMLGAMLSYAWLTGGAPFAAGAGLQEGLYALALMAIFAAAVGVTALVSGYQLRSAEIVSGRENMLHTVLDALPVGVWVCAPSGATVFVNERWASFSLMSVAEIMASDSVQAPFDLGEAWEAQRQALLSGARQGVSCQRLDLSDAAGRHCHMTVLTLKVYIDAVHGVGTLSLLVDETALRLYEQRIQTSEYRLRMAMETVEMAFWEQDLQAQTVYRDAHWYRMLQLDPAEVTNERQEWQGRIHPDDRSRVLGAYRAFLADSAAPLEIDYRLRQGADGYIWVHNRVVGLEHDPAGRLRRLIGTMQDISARKRIEIDLQHARDRAEAGNRAKSHFIATVSHEIRTPLNAILGLSSLLCDTELDAEQLDLSQTIHSSGNSLLLLVNDLLDFSKIEAGRLELTVQEFPLRACFEECIKLFKSRAVQGRTAVQLTVDPALPEFALGDMERLRQVISNLLDNALKFTEQGHVEIVLQVVALSQLPLERRPDPQQAIGYLDDSDCDYLQVLVRDTGIGIAPDSQHDLFEAFSQVDASATRAYGGTGLGLAICQRLVAAMGGKIWLVSQLGEGAEFGFVVRTKLIDDSEPLSLRAPDRAESAVAAESTDRAGTLERLAEQQPCDLLIVGNRVEALPLVRACRELGYSPHQALGYELSDDVLQRRRYQLVFIYMSDEAAALELSRQVRAARWSKRPPAVVGVLADGQCISPERCKLAGMQHTLSGDWNTEVIRDLLLDVLCVRD